MKDYDNDYFYEDSEDRKYCYPGTHILKNKLDLRDADALHEKERAICLIREAEMESMRVTGNFSLKHLQSIHKHLFQDIYSWAGKIRTVDIAKGNSFCRVQYIAEMFDDLYTRLKSDNLLKDINDRKAMIEKIAFYLSEVNAIHPFREGNGRTQRMYFRQMCVYNGRFRLDFSNATREEMRQASIQSFACKYDAMERLINKCLVEL